MLQARLVGLGAQAAVEEMLQTMKNRISPDVCHEYQGNQKSLTMLTTITRNQVENLVGSVGPPGDMMTTLQLQAQLAQKYQIFKSLCKTLS